MRYACVCVTQGDGEFEREREREELRDDRVVRERVMGNEQGICVRMMSAPKISSLE